MSIVVWSIIFALVILFAIGATRLAAREKEQGLQDTGLAILEFNRAYPQEAIRALQSTADGEAVYVRLHDNKAGFMRNMRRHYVCHIIEPGRVRVVSTESGKGLEVDFLDAPYHSGRYEFTSAKEASEVALWLLGNYVAEPDKVLPVADVVAANKF